MRVEVTVSKQDAMLVRRVARALGDPGRAAEARAILRQRFARHPSRDIKALLAAMPAVDIDLERSPDMGRSIDL